MHRVGSFLQIIRHLFTHVDSDCFCILTDWICCHDFTFRCADYVITGPTLFPIQSGLISNSIEFDGIKIRVIQLLPNPEKLNRIPGSHPVLDNIIAPLCIAMARDIRQRDKILFMMSV